jgi:hypothetical protein
LVIVACRNESPPPSTSPAASSPSEDVTGAAPTRQRESPLPANDAGEERLGAATSPAPASTRPAAASAPSLRLLPLADAKAGEWCRYRMRDEQMEELRVVSVDPGAVEVEVKMFRKGKPLGLPATRQERSDEDRITAHARRVGAEVTTSESPIEAAGMRWPCRLITEAWTDEGVGYVRRTWYHDAAPVYGMVKMEQAADGQPVAFMELVDYGPR